MKLSVSLPVEDVAALDSYAAAAGLPSRSAALQRAVRLLRESALEDQYAEAFAEWDGSEDSALWDSVAGDGLTDAPR